MKFVKYYENIDPFDEEDWDEIDSHYSTFKIWIGATNKEIRILCFPAHIQKKGSNTIHIRDDRYKRIWKDIDFKFEKRVKRVGLPTGNCFIIDKDDYDERNIISFVRGYLTSRKNSCMSKIKSYNKMLNDDYEFDEDEEENFDYEETERKIELEELLLNNIKEIMSGRKIETEIKKLIKYVVD